MSHLDRNNALEDRLIKFAVVILDVTEDLPANFAGKNLAHQLSRSGISPALNYGEAQAAESRSDFIHKMKIVLKQLRETFCSLRIIEEKEWISTPKIASALHENNQLIAIFTKSILTAQRNNISKPKQ